MFIKSSDLSVVWGIIVTLLFVLCTLIGYDIGASNTKRSAVTLSTFEYKGTVYEVVKSIEESKE